MQLTTKGRYAVMALVDMVKHADHNIPVRLALIAKRQDITLNYLEQIFLKLKLAGLVTSVRGPGGGYKLAKMPQSTFISEVIDAVDESVKITRCKSHSATGCMNNNSRCLTHDLWEGLSNHIYTYLQRYSLQDVCDGNVDTLSQSESEKIYAS